MSTPEENRTSRRQFLKTSTTAVVRGAIAGPVILAPKARAVWRGDRLRVGLMGCGGGGSGAANQALHADKNVKLTALGDAFEDQLANGLKSLQAEHQDKVQVEPDHRFVGLDAYQKVIDSGVDVIILGTPPGFRPIHLQAAVAAGKHGFAEKPIAVDAPARSALLAARA